MKTRKFAGMLVAAVMTVCALGVGVTVKPVAAFTVAECPGYETATDKSAFNEKAASIAECFIKDERADKGGLMGTLTGILNAVFGVIGFVAVVMLIYGGVQYTISAGDAGKVKKAKDTILYGVVGLILSLLAAAIVNFVLVNVLK